MKEYSKGIYVKFKPEEVEILHNRMKEAGVQNMSAYIRKMALNGYVIIPEWPDLNQVISLHSRISNNLNLQIPLHRITDSVCNGSVFPVVTEHFSAFSDHALLYFVIVFS